MAIFWPCRRWRGSLKPTGEDQMCTFSLDPEVVRSLARLLDETGLTEIEFSEGDRRIRLNRQPAPVSHGAVTSDGLLAATSPPAQDVSSW